MEKSALSKRERIDQIFRLMRKFTHEKYIGEEVSQLTHALQCAYFAGKSKGDETAVLGALLHDTGHLCAGPDAPQMADLGVLNHEEIGAQYLRDLGVDEAVCELVRTHVQGKRYLCFKLPSYFKQLSEASLGTLAFQGGPMAEAEARAFEQNPLFEQMILVRKADEMAKQVDLVVPELEAYRDMLGRHMGH